MIVLGLNIFHGDAAACIIKDKKIIIAIEEERINRIKHSSGFPIKSIKHCLDQTNLKISQTAQFGKNASQTIAHMPKTKSGATVATGISQKNATELTKRRANDKQQQNRLLDSALSPGWPNHEQHAASQRRRGAGASTDDAKVRPQVQL